MPVYNTNEDYFREAIESVLAQSFGDFELIIADDCSKGYIAEILSSYSDKRIRYFRTEENGGAAKARNLAIFKALGKYLAFLDSDDIALEKRLEKQYAYLEQNPGIGCLGTMVEIFGDKQKNMHFPKPLKHQEIEEYLLFGGCVFCQSSVMLRKEVIRENNLYYKTEYVPAEDYALWLDLIGKTKFEVLPEVLVKYRFYAQNISNVQNEKQKKKCLEAQFAALEKCFSLQIDNKEALYSFFLEDSMDKGAVYSAISRVVNALLEKGVSFGAIYLLFGRRFKKIYYRTRSLSGQWALLKSPLNGLLKVPLAWRLFCLITRGVL